MTDPVLKLAETLCNDFDARVIADQVTAPLFATSEPHVQDYWRALALAAYKAAPGGWQDMASAPVEEYVLLHFPGPFHDSECPGTSVGKLTRDGRFWLTGIWASSIAHAPPDAWQPLPSPPAITNTGDAS